MLLGLLLAAITSAGTAAAPTASAGYPDALVREARARHLSEDPEWRRLLHARTGWFGGVTSDAVGKGFFLSPEGRTDPEAELEATLRGFFAPPPKGDAQHPQCRFPARLSWLARTLKIDLAKLPPQRCAKFQEFWSRVQARSVTLVFSSYYLNNPASAFGHTFLRLDKGDSARNGKHFELMDYGIDYAATVDTQNSVLYALKGLTGMFHGNWNNYPFFYKVRQYSDYESRDLWEFDLALTPQETAMLVAHLWELGWTWFPYYYLTQNCSFGILSALEAAAPRLNLLSHVGYVTIPSDTVKALFETPGLVKSVHYRPSIRRQFMARAAALSSEETDALRALVDDPAVALPKLSVQGQANALDAALDYVDFRWAHDLLDNVPTPAADLKQKLMERRSQLRVQSADLEVPMPLGEQPQLGHGSMRAGLGGGYSSRRGPLAVLDFRLALHDLADPPDGYPAEAQIEFLPTRLRYEPDHNALRLDRTMLVEITSLSDFGAFDRHVSWSVRLGALTTRDSGCLGCLTGVAELAGGFSKTLFSGHLTAFVFSDAQLLGGPDLSGLDGAPVRVGLGPSGGLRLRFGEHLALLAEGAFRYLPFANPRTTFELSLDARVHLGNKVSLFAEAHRWPRETQLLGGTQLFF